MNCLVEKFKFDEAGVKEAVERMQSGKVRFRSVLVMD